MEILEQGTFSSLRDVTKLNIVDWGRLNGSFNDPYEAMETIASWLVGLASYSSMLYFLLHWLHILRANEWRRIVSSGGQGWKR